MSQRDDWKQKHSGACDGRYKKTAIVAFGRGSEIIWQQSRWRDRQDRICRCRQFDRGRVSFNRRAGTTIDFAARERRCAQGTSALHRREADARADPRPQRAAPCRAASAAPQRRRSVPSNAPAADRDPYAIRRALQGDPVQASANSRSRSSTRRRSITVLTRKCSQDKNATTLKQAVPEHGRRDARHRRGRQRVRRPLLHPRLRRAQRHLHRWRARSGVSVRENFFTEQVEILRGPARPSPAAARPAARSTSSPSRPRRRSFYNMDDHVWHRQDQARRARRQPSDQSDSSPCAPADCSRTRASPAATTSPTTATAASSRRNGRRSTRSRSPPDYIHTELTALPDFGVPYYRPSTAQHGRRAVPRFRRQPQQLVRLRQSRLLRSARTSASLNAEVQITPDLTVHQQDPGVQLEPELHRHAAGTPALACIRSRLDAHRANPQSRYQAPTCSPTRSRRPTSSTTRLASSIRCSAASSLAGERSTIDRYAGLTSEARTGAHLPATVRVTA